jgi:hypothetical protein
MSGVIKSIPRENYLIRPFRTNKTQAYEIVYLSGSNPPQISVDLAIVPPPVTSWQFDPSTSPINSSSGIFQETLYASVKHIFYQSGSQFNSGVQLPFPSGNLYVFSVAQQALGEGIRPGSFTLDAGIIFKDDAFGGLTSSVSGSTPLGNIFYDLGIAVLPVTALSLDTGSDLSIEFDATHTIYEHQIVCTMDQGEFNYSFNPSIKASSSFDGDDIKVLDKLASGTLTPYFTTIGLFSHEGILVAVGKVPQPIKRAVESQQTVIIRFDV